MSQMMSVNSLNIKIKTLLEATFMHIVVEGEVSSVTYHSSGHLYFSIKDRDSSIKCVMWRSAVVRMKFKIEKGMHIVVNGSISVYTPRGEYQFQSIHIEPYGQGALALAYEQLKEKLKTKGYFDTHIKKPIPKYIYKIALVTAKQSAALFDMLKIIENRWPLVEIFIVDTVVQGDKASSQISKALKYADTLNVDVVVVGRGGGSAEDLWSFNEELVADTLFGMHTPVVSAVGHEVDTMISDFVADVRAPTPSAAIEMILPDSKEILQTLVDIECRYKQNIEIKIQKSIKEIGHADEIWRRVSPYRQLNDKKVESEQLTDEYNRIMRYLLEKYTNQLPAIESELSQKIHFIIDNKSFLLKQLNEKFILNNPKLQCHAGWGKISISGKSVDIDNVKVNQKFTIEDATIKIEAQCLDKTLK